MIALAVCAVRERVRLAIGDVSRKGLLCDLVRCAMGSSGLHGIGLSSGFGMTTLGSGAGGVGMTTLGGGAEGLTFR